MRKLLISAGMLIALATIAYALAYAFADLDRHADYTDSKKPGPAQCKPFYGTDDNRTACMDWCQLYLQSNEGATCACAEGKCPEDEKANP